MQSNNNECKACQHIATGAGKSNNEKNGELWPHKDCTCHKGGIGKVCEYCQQQNECHCKHKSWDCLGLVKNVAAHVVRKCSDCQQQNVGKRVYDDMNTDIFIPQLSEEKMKQCLDNPSPSEPIEQDWEDEFDRKWFELEGVSKTLNQHRWHMKDYVRSLLLQERKRCAEVIESAHDPKCGCPAEDVIKYAQWKILNQPPTK